MGIKAPLVTVEAHLSNGLPGFSIVGLPETAVKESKDRVRSAILNSGYEFPRRRITVNLAPADLPKEGGRFDLPIALSILGASRQIPTNLLSDYEFAGELALTGEFRAIPGVLPVAIASKAAGRNLIIPQANALEASLINGASIFPANSLVDVCRHLCETDTLNKLSTHPVITTPAKIDLDLIDVQGQHFAKRALKLAAGGGHSLLMVGPPGCGKTMLASRLPGILPPLSEEKAIEVAALYSLTSHGFQTENFRIRPFRSPHHTASSVALVGGGRYPKPGEISLAHNGVLFLDELPEYERRVLEALREPLESGMVNISRASQQIEFPARFQLIAAMNPCPCGHLGDTQKECRCTFEQIHRYHQKLSGPFLDRIDMNVQVANLPLSFLNTKNRTEGESSAQIREQVTALHVLQLERQGKLNNQLSPKEIDEHCMLNDENQNWLTEVMEKLKVSARAYHRLLRVARTIADFSGSEHIEKTHLTEALAYRKAPLTHAQRHREMSA
jgi:magnesium chelatase family protein